MFRYFAYLMLEPGLHVLPLFRVLYATASLTVSVMSCWNRACMFRNFAYFMLEPGLHVPLISRTSCYRRTVY